MYVSPSALTEWSVLTVKTVEEGDVSFQKVASSAHPTVVFKTK